MSVSTFTPITSSSPASQSTTFDAGSTVNGVYTPLMLTISASAGAPANSSTGTPYEESGQLFYRSPEKDNASWSQIRKSGQIKMSNYSVFNSSFRNTIGSIGFNAYDWAYYHSARCNSSSGSPKTYWWGVVGPHEVSAASSWTQNGDLAYWKGLYPTLPHYKGTFNDASQEIEKAKTDAWSSVLSGYSLGSEIGEVKQTIDFIRNVLTTVRHPLEAYSNARSLILWQYKTGNRYKKAADLADALSDLWLQYRYALMPLIYSVKDVLKLMATSPEYITERRHVNETFDSYTVDTAGSYFFTENTSAERNHSITVKGRFSAGSSSADRVDINWLTTAWELIPYSFVVDWFINVGDWVAAQAKTLSSSADIIGCVATKEKITTRTGLHLKWDERRSFTSAAVTGGGCGTIGNFSRPAKNVAFGALREQTIYLKEESNDHYVRQVFTSSDLSLTFEPDLNWKRYVDASALTLSKLTNALRRLK